MTAEALSDTTQIRKYRQRCDKFLQQHFGKPRSTLDQAMAYAVLGGGKRMRPLLAYAAAQAMGHCNDTVDRVAAALECIHAYSLVHDDLPSMDDDDLRRGQPTCHIQFDEAMAILAGDALQAKAFELLSSATNTPPGILVQLIKWLAKAAGAEGMVLGQALDIEAVNQSVNLHYLQSMHAHKTGALIKASIVMGALSSEMATDEDQDSLATFADHIGLAFQIKDDILDVTADTETLGKPQGADEGLNKPTYVSILGLEQAQQTMEDHYYLGIEAIDYLGNRASLLRALAQQIVTRNH